MSNITKAVTYYRCDSPGCEEEQLDPMIKCSLCANDVCTDHTTNMDFVLTGGGWHELTGSKLHSFVCNICSNRVRSMDGNKANITKALTFVLKEIRDRFKL